MYISSYLGRRYPDPASLLAWRDPCSQRNCCFSLVRGYQPHCIGLLSPHGVFLEITICHQHVPVQLVFDLKSWVFVCCPDHRSTCSTPPNRSQQELDEPDCGSDWALRWASLSSTDCLSSCLFLTCLWGLIPRLPACLLALTTNYCTCLLVADSTCCGLFCPTWLSVNLPVSVHNNETADPCLPSVPWMKAVFIPLDCAALGSQSGTSAARITCDFQFGDLHLFSFRLSCCFWGRNHQLPAESGQNCTAMPNLDCLNLCKYSQSWNCYFQSGLTDFKKLWNELRSFHLFESDLSRMRLQWFHAK